MNSVKFGCTALVGSNKIGDLKQDDDGYYEIVVGALNVFNSAGQFYTYDQSADLFKSSSQFMRRVGNGNLKGENGHPKLTVGQTQEEFARRVMSIYEERVCCHHKEIYLDNTRIKDEKGQPVIAIMSRVAPTGELGYVLENALKRKDENICFSIRSFTKDYYDKGVIKRAIQTIVTFDLVTEPGIAYANKFRSPGLECFDKNDGLVLTRGQLERAVMQGRASNAVGMESVVMTADDLFKTMGWTNDSTIQGQGPAWSQW